MKTKLALFATMLMLISAGAFASEKRSSEKDLLTNLELKSNNRVELNLQNMEGRTLTFEVFDEVGENILSKKLGGKSRASIHHKISDIDAGLYTYRVKDGEKVLYSAKMLKNQDGSAELRCAENQMCAAITPVPGVENQVEVRLHKSLTSVATIVIVDDSGEIISERKEKDGRSLILNYNLSSLPTGTYIVKVLDGKNLAGYRKINL